MSELRKKLREKGEIEPIEWVTHDEDKDNYEDSELYLSVSDVLTLFDPLFYEKLECMKIL